MGRTGPLSEFEEACRLRFTYWKREVFLRAIVEFSNHCRQNCLYCGLRRDNARIRRYRLNYEQIYACAALAKRLKMGTVVLQSGEDHWYSGQALADLIFRIKTELGLAVTLSLGERKQTEYLLWREAGADRYLLKMETWDAEAYARLRPGKKMEDRLENFMALAELGYETGSGIIAGLPGDTEDSLRQACLRLAALKPDMISISPFVPHPATPLRGHPGLDAETTLQLMAFARILAPTAHIPVTSALGLQGDAVRLRALQVADVLMPSLTPAEVREEYSIYAGKNRQAAMPEERAVAMRALLLESGFTLPSGAGGAWRTRRSAG
jgi:biotin synthase